MNNKSLNGSRYLGIFSLAVLLLVSARPLMAQDPVPVDEDGNPLAIATISEVVDYYAADEQLPTVSASELQEFVGPIALYPDTLLAIVLPASTYPLQIVLAARFLEQLESDSTLQPDETWDESVVALLNYPEVIQMMNDNIQWTWQLGEAVVAQETDVLNAIESFRELAYTAGNLKSDEFQEVSNSDEAIVITQTNETVVYVPYYVPEEVIVYQPRPVYHYYPTAYPVYYYPYSSGHRFRSSFFWGVTTAFSIGWVDHHLHVYHPSYSRHPYYGRHYNSRYNYRRTDIRAFNRYYVNNNYRRSQNRYRDGSYWQPQRGSGARPYDRRARNYTRTSPRGLSTLNGNQRIASDRGNRRNRDDNVAGQNRGNGVNRVGRGDRQSGAVRANRAGNSNRNTATNGRSSTPLSTNRSNALIRNNATPANESRRGRNANGNSITGSGRRASTQGADNRLANQNVLTNNRNSQSADRRRTSNPIGNRNTVTTRQNRRDLDSGSIAGRRSAAVTNPTANTATGRSLRENTVRTQSNSNRSTSENRRSRDATNSRALAQSRSQTNTRRSTRAENPGISRNRQQVQSSQLRQNNRVTNRSNTSRSRVDRNRRTSPIQSRTRQSSQAPSRQRSAPPNRRAESSSRSNRASAPAVSRSAPSSSRRANSGNSRSERRNRREP